MDIDKIKEVFVWIYNGLYGLVTGIYYLLVKVFNSSNEWMANEPNLSSVPEYARYLIAGIATLIVFWFILSIPTILIRGVLPALFKGTLADLGLSSLSGSTSANTSGASTRRYRPTVIFDDPSYVVKSMSNVSGNWKAKVGKRESGSDVTIRLGSEISRHIQGGNVGAAHYTVHWGEG